MTSLADLLAPAIPAGCGIKVTAYDGSSAGRPDAPVTIDIRSRLALARLASAPGELGLIRAYVSGDLDIVGDVYTALKEIESLNLAAIPWQARAEIAAKLALSRISNPLKPPKEEARLRGRRHSKQRDRAAIAYHYDVSNDFYELLLGPSMSYTCAYYFDESTTLQQAQYAKHELISTKLRLRQGMRLLDLGCGWGGMVMHAAGHHGVKALGVTLSRAQAQWAQKAIKEAGLAEMAEVRHLDYRDVTESGFDAVSSIGLTEHIGKAQLPNYFRFVYARLAPGGRLLNHTSTRADNRRHARTRSFLDRYVWPDVELVGVGRLVTLMQEAGFEVRHSENLREHYATTLRDWSRNLDDHWDESVAEIGLARARIWRLYLAGGRRGYERNLIQHHQVLGAKLA